MSEQSVIQTTSTDRCTATDLRKQWLEGFDIVCLATSEWMTVRSLPEHTMLRLAERNRILMVSPFKSFNVMLRFAAEEGLQVGGLGLRQIQQNIWTYTPPPLGLPAHSRLLGITPLNARLFARLIQSVIHKLGWSSPLLWSFQYTSAEVLRRVGARLCIYDTGDNDAALVASKRRKRIAEAADAKTCRAADLVFACTEALADRARRFNPHAYAVPCAGDREFFGRALAPALEVPPDLACLPGPVIGYVGAVDPWKIDVELLRAIAKAQPSWTFALVGFVWFGFDREVFADRPNVHVLGGRPYETFPAYLRGMDVCIAPFAINDLTRYGDSLKIYEYLGAGRPVVSTPIPAALRLADGVHVAQDARAFVDAIKLALSDTPQRQRERLDLVSHHTWDHRVAQKSQLVREALTRTASATG